MAMETPYVCHGATPSASQLVAHLRKKPWRTTDRTLRRGEMARVSHQKKREERIIQTEKFEFVNQDKLGVMFFFCECNMVKCWIYGHFGLCLLMMSKLLG